jgi:hypothetical protein
MNLSSLYAVDIWLCLPDLELICPDFIEADLTLLIGLGIDFCDAVFAVAIIAVS